MTDYFTLVNERKGQERQFDTRSKAEEQKDKLIGLGMKPENLDIKPPGEDTAADGGPEVVETTKSGVDTDGEPQETRATHPEAFDNEDSSESDETDVVSASEELPDERPGVDKDPLDVLPAYMIDTVQGQPTLNKRGLSVLAYHYDVSITGREIVVTPHESEWEYAIVETTIENADGNTFVGTGTAHVDRGDDKGVLLEMAETRSYKRAVSFGTGTGIVSYQEMVNSLE